MGASQATFSEGKLDVHFGESDVTAVIGVTLEKRYFTFEVLSVSDASVDEVVFVDVPLKVQGSLEDMFQASALALNIQADITDLPGPSRHLVASCFPRPGFVGAKAAILGCPQGKLRDVMKEVVCAAKDLPQTDRGGPWALDSAANRGSYLIDYPGSISETNVEKWIATAKGIGAKQIDFHTGHTLRFGDYEPDPAVYRRGFESLKTVIDRLRAAGIAAGLPHLRVLRRQEQQVGNAGAGPATRERRNVHPGHGFAGGSQNCTGRGNHQGHVNTDGVPGSQQRDVAD